MAFASAMKQFFGLKTGQTIMQFGAELRDLSLDEKKQFAEMLRGQGIECDDPIPPKAS